MLQFGDHLSILQREHLQQQEAVIKHQIWRKRVEELKKRQSYNELNREEARNQEEEAAEDDNNESILNFIETHYSKTYPTCSVY